MVWELGGATLPAIRLDLRDRLSIIETLKRLCKRTLV